MENFSSMIDHTLLAPQSTREAIKAICSEASSFNFKSVCVPPHYVRLAKEQLKDGPVLVCTVIGFPLGYNRSGVKVFETKEAIKEGADEIDMVINNALLQDGLYEEVSDDIQQVVKAAQGRTVKVILETCLLSDDMIIKACECAEKAGAHFVKTSTGFSQSGATSSAVALMKKSIPQTMQVKASGGIRTSDNLREMIEAGATRLGTSASVSITQGLSNHSKSTGDY
jgi:deoxyribose-phosphate aldolase